MANCYGLGLIAANLNIWAGIAHSPCHDPKFSDRQAMENSVDLFV